MPRSLLQRCTSCGAYGLERVCPTCGGTAFAAAPLRFSPQDHQGARRRVARAAADPDWMQQLPRFEEE